jgi:hypothetical protein
MKIDSIQHLTNTLHLQFTNKTKSKIEKFDPVVLKIVAQYELLCASIEKEDLCYKIIRKSYFEKQATKPPFRMVDARNETDDAYNKITLVINALIVMEGETVYAPFIAEQNELINHYSDLIAQYLGRNA